MHSVFLGTLLWHCSVAAGVVVYTPGNFTDFSQNATCLQGCKRRVHAEFLCDVLRLPAEPSQWAGRSSSTSMCSTAVPSRCRSTRGPPRPLSAVSCCSLQIAPFVLTPFPLSLLNVKPGFFCRAANLPLSFSYHCHCNNPCLACQLVQLEDLLNPFFFTEAQYSWDAADARHKLVKKCIWGLVGRHCECRH